MDNYGIVSLIGLAAVLLLGTRSLLQAKAPQGRAGGQAASTRRRRRRRRTPGN